MMVHNGSWDTECFKRYLSRRRLHISAAFGETFKMGQAESAYYSIFGLEMLPFQDPSPEFGQSY